MAAVEASESAGPKDPTAYKLDQRFGGRDQRREKFLKKQALAEAAAQEVPGAWLPPYCDWIVSADAPEVQVFTDLKNHNFPARENHFIAEGPETIKLLLESQLDIVSLFLKPSTFKKMRAAGAFVTLESQGEPYPYRVLVCEKDLMKQIVGYLARGALASGTVPKWNLDWLRSTVLSRHPNTLRVLAIDQTLDSANLGGLIRSAHAFGIHCVLLSGNSVDEWCRRSVRVSMGHIFQVPVVRCDDLADTLAQLREDISLESFAAVIDTDAPLLRRMTSVPPKWCIVVGCEDDGISPKVRAACSGGPVRIGMAAGVDSLNIGVAAGVLLNGFCEREGDGPDQHQ